MLKIRLRRMGAKKAPFYRIVVADSRNVQIDEKQLKKTLAIIKSMTPKERAKPELLNASRRRRIAAGSGNSVQEVNRLLNQFESSRKLMKQLSSGKFGKKGKMRFPFGF